MTRDIDEIVRRVREAIPGVRVEQLRVTHAADDDGLWFFTTGTCEAQLESSSGMCPFLLESDAHDARREVRTVDEAVSAVCSELR